MNKLVRGWNFIRRHKYLITTVAFVVVIGFIDENNLIRRAKYQYEIIMLRKEINHYREMFERDTERLDELQSSPDGIEKVARERYLMKSPDEDIYIFEKTE